MLAMNFNLLHARTICAAHTSEAVRGKTINSDNIVVKVRDSGALATVNRCCRAADARPTILIRLQCIRRLSNLV
jgi:hypothetical protein